MAEKNYKLSARTTVIGTGTDAVNFPKGVERVMHSRLADKLIARGVVALKKASKSE